jgi:hypothetical protein
MAQIIGRARALVTALRGGVLSKFGPQCPNPPPSDGAINTFTRKHRVVLVHKAAKGIYAFRYDDSRAPQQVAEEMKSESVPKVVNVEPVM